MEPVLPHLSRRGFLRGGGAIVVSFSLTPYAFAQQGEVQGSGAGAQPAKPQLPGSLTDEPRLGAWIRIDADGKVSVFTGKAELGQGVKTALRQIAAEELEIAPEAITLITADTGRTPNEGYTAGSQSMQMSGAAIRNAAAQVREILIGQASIRMRLPAEQLQARDGAVVASDGRRAAYADLVPPDLLSVQAQPQSKLKATADFKIMGKPWPRVDIPAKVTGGAAYVQDIRLPGMVHARVVRPPSYGAKLGQVDTGSIAKMAGVLTVVRDGDFLAVAAEKEWQAVKAMRELSSVAQWSEKPALPHSSDLPTFLQSLPLEDGVVARNGSVPASFAKEYQATYTRAYQAHGSIGPSCAVAYLDGDRMTVWTHTQGVYPDRAAIAQMLAMPPEKVRCIHTEGSGCYGHNGADDAAGDAALIARAMPGRPVRLQLMREQEHSWEPYGPAMVTKVRAGLDAAGRIAGWDYQLWSNTHSTRPGSAGSLLAARHMSAHFPLDEPKLEITPSGNGDRNADPLYAIPARNVVWHFIKDMPLRVSALRGLGAYANVFSIESTMDELALLAGVDPVQFRLAHLDDERARGVIQLAAEKSGWPGGPLPDGQGRGFAFARYKNHASYLAIAVEVEVAHESGRVRVRNAVAAIDSGEVVNPDGLRNQTEGGILQSISWTLYEAVAFDDTRIQSIDWSTYPIMRFDAVPGSVSVHILNRPGQAFLGAAEAAQGPTAAAVANAIRNATGKRLYDLPFTRERVKQAIGV